MAHWTARADTREMCLSIQAPISTPQSLMSKFHMLASLVLLQAKVSHLARQ